MFRAAFLLRALARWAFFAIASGRRSPLRGGGRGASLGPPKKKQAKQTKQVAGVPVDKDNWPPPA